MALLPLGAVFGFAGNLCLAPFDTGECKSGAVCLHFKCETVAFSSRQIDVCGQNDPCLFVLGAEGKSVVRFNFELDFSGR